MHYTRMLVGIEVGISSVQQTTIVPHKEIALAPAVAINKFVFGSMRFEVNDQLVSFGIRHTVNVGGVHPKE